MALTLPLLPLFCLLSPPGPRVSCADAAGRPATSAASDQRRCPWGLCGLPWTPRTFRAHPRTARGRHLRPLPLLSRTHMPSGAGLGTCWRLLDVSSSGPVLLRLNPSGWTSKRRPSSQGGSIRGARDRVRARVTARDESAPWAPRRAGDRRHSHGRGRTSGEPVRRGRSHSPNLSHSPSHPDASAHVGDMSVFTSAETGRLVHVPTAPGMVLRLCRPTRRVPGQGEPQRQDGAPCCLPIPVTSRSSLALSAPSRSPCCPMAPPGQRLQPPSSPCGL